MHDLSDSEIRALQMEFCREATERLDICEAYLLETDILTNAERLKDLKRILHGLKGSSVATGMDEFGTMVHGMESQLIDATPNEKLIDGLLKKIDLLRAMVSDLANS